MMRRLRRFSLTSLVVLVAALAASGSTAAASVIIGQTGSDPFTGCVGVSTYDFVQPTVTTSTSYIAPATGVITSWSHSARDEANQQVTMKIWRLVSGTTYRAVGHDGPRPLTAGVVNTFGGISVPVQPGDVLGLNVSAGAYTACFFPAAGDSVLLSGGTNTADGEEATFVAAPGFRANISAVVEPDCDHDGLGDETQDPALPPACKPAPVPAAPSNAITLGKPKLNMKKGTAKEPVTVPGPGTLTLTGKGVVKQMTTPTAAGTVKLLVKSKGKQKKGLNTAGKVKVKITVTYTPTGGNPSIKSTKLVLKKRLH